MLSGVFLNDCGRKSACLSVGLFFNATNVTPLQGLASYGQCFPDGAAWRIVLRNGKVQTVIGGATLASQQTVSLTIWFLWILKGVTATLQSGRYTLWYQEGSPQRRFATGRFATKLEGPPQL